MCLLLIDSLTRFAMAQREIGLAIGEIPASRGYPPSVFQRIAALCERAGNGEDRHAAASPRSTPFWSKVTISMIRSGIRRARSSTVISCCRADSPRAVFSPHSMSVASISRVMPAIVSSEQIALAQRFKQLWNRLEESRDIIALGGYRPGHDAELDRAVALRPAIESFLRQDMTNAVSFADSVAALGELLGD